jgi:hypothetical protein
VAAELTVFGGRYFIVSQNVILFHQKSQLFEGFVGRKVLEWNYHPTQGVASVVFCFLL